MMHRVSKLFFIGLVVLAGLAAADSVSAQSSFQSLTVDRPSLQANGQDVQTARLVINTSNTSTLDDVTIAINYMRGQSDPSEMRGQFVWNPIDGFYENGADQFGNEHVILLPENYSYSATGSQRIYDSVAGTATFVFRWTATSSYGTVLDNDITYEFGESSRGWYAPIAEINTSFAVTAAPMPLLDPIFRSLIVDRQNMLANSQDVQTASLVINTANPTALDDALIAINYTEEADQSRMRGVFAWNPSQGFHEYGGNFFGNQHVNLLPTNATNPIQGSQRIDDFVSGTATFIFRWTANPSYGAVLDNDLSYEFGESSRGWYAPMAVENTSFVVYPLVVSVDSAVQVSIDNRNPAAGNFYGGQQGVTLAAFNFLVTTTQDVEIEEIKFSMLTTDPRLASYQDYDLLYLEDANGVLLGVVVPTSTTPVMNFAPGAFVVRGSSPAGQTVYLKADLTRVAVNSNVTMGGHRLGFKIDSFLDVKAKGVQTGGRSSVYIMVGHRSVAGNTHYLYRAIPEVRVLSGPTTALANGMNELYRFQISARGADVGLHLITADIRAAGFASGTGLNWVELVDVTTAGFEWILSSALLWPAVGTTATSTSFFIDLYGNGSPSEITVFLGRPRTLVIRGNVAGAVTGASVQTSLVGDSVPYDRGQVTVMGDHSEVRGNFVWSDRHHGAHHITTPDWTNGYLVPGLPSGTTTPTMVSL